MPTTQSADRYQLVRGVRTASGFRGYEALHGDKADGVLVDVFTGTGPMPAPVRALERDVATVSSLHHPHILRTLELTTLPDGTPIVVSELPAGETLRAWLDAGNTAPAGVAMALVVALADALAAAHACGVQHGALCAENVFLAGAASGAPGFPKLKGFGLEWLREAPGTSPVGVDDEEVDRIHDGRGSTVSVAGDIAALARLAERLLTLMEPPATEIDRRFILGDEVIALLERAGRQSPGEAFESVTRFVVELKAAVMGEPDRLTGENEPVSAGGPRRTRLGMALGVASFVATVAVAVVLGATPLGLPPRRWRSPGPRVETASPGRRAEETRPPVLPVSLTAPPAPAGGVTEARAFEATIAPGDSPVEARRPESDAARAGAEIRPSGQGQGRGRGRGIVWSPSLGRVVYFAPTTPPLR